MQYGNNFINKQKKSFDDPEPARYIYDYANDEVKSLDTDYEVG